MVPLEEQNTLTSINFINNILLVKTPKYHYILSFKVQSSKIQFQIIKRYNVLLTQLYLTKDESCIELRNVKRYNMWHEQSNEEWLEDKSNFFFHLVYFHLQTHTFKHHISSIIKQENSNTQKQILQCLIMNDLMIFDINLDELDYSGLNEANVI